MHLLQVSSKPSITSWTGLFQTEL